MNNVTYRVVLCSLEIFFNTDYLTLSRVSRMQEGGDTRTRRRRMAASSDAAAARQLPTQLASRCDSCQVSCNPIITNLEQNIKSILMLKRVF